MSRPSPAPLVSALAMGYGHLRAAHALADALGGPVWLADRPPLAGEDEARLWSTTRRLYENATRISQLPLGAPLRWLVERITAIPPFYPRRDLSRPDLSARFLRRRLEQGLGRGLVERLHTTGAPLVTSYFTPALAADLAGYRPVWCVVTDSDLARAWVPVDPSASAIHYLAPSRRAGRRLEAYGVAPERIHLTGFPLPHELLGGPQLGVLRTNLARRLARLDPRRAFRDEMGSDVERGLAVGAADEPAGATGGPPHVVFAVGGAGAQTDLGERLTERLADALRQGRLRLTLVAGVRADVAAGFERAIGRAGLDDLVAADGSDDGDGDDRAPLALLVENDAAAYFRRFNRLLADADVLWTKPSELSFFAALGLPLVLSPPVGSHERYNRRWLLEHGAALVQRNLDDPAGWLAELLADGTLAATAWSGFSLLPKQGLYRILARLGAAAPASAGESADTADESGRRHGNDGAPRSGSLPRPPSPRSIDRSATP